MDFVVVISDEAEQGPVLQGQEDVMGCRRSREENGPRDGHLVKRRGFHQRPLLGPKLAIDLLLDETLDLSHGQSGTDRSSGAKELKGQRMTPESSSQVHEGFRIFALAHERLDVVLAQTLQFQLADQASEHDVSSVVEWDTAPREDEHLESCGVGRHILEECENREDLRRRLLRVVDDEDRLNPREVLTDDLVWIAPIAAR